MITDNIQDIVLNKVLPLFLAILVWVGLYYSAQNKFDFFKGVMATAVVLAIAVLFLSGL